MTRDAPVDVVRRQLDAYNRRDLDAFCATFAPDAAIFELGATAPSSAGLAAIRERYRGLFDASPALHSAVVARMALGRVVIDHEHVTGRNGSPDVYAVIAIYEVADGLIRRVHFVRA
jgi:hypothetical protein